MSDAGARTSPDQTGESAVEHVVEDVKDVAAQATSFVARLGGALKDGYQDGRDRP